MQILNCLQVLLLGALLVNASPILSPPIDGSLGNLTSRNVAPRNQMGAPLCTSPPGQQWNSVLGGSLEEAITDTKKLPAGSCATDAGKCLRVGCRGSAGIFFCNDSNETLSVDCYTVATYAEDIRTNCMFFIKALGQQYDTGNWHVNVKKSNCAWENQT